LPSQPQARHSDWFAIFAPGRFVPAFVHDMTWSIVGRVIQEMGVVSSVVIACRSSGDRRRADSVPLSA
jgi:hypothetical protein